MNRVIETGEARIAYERVGNGAPVLLVQGAGVVGAGWRPQVAALRDRYTLVSWDNRGIGASTFRTKRLSIEDMAADALAIADAEGFDRFHVVGHSMGGLIAQQLALTSPSRVLSLAFLCTFLQGRQAARLTWDMFVTALRTRIGTRAMRREAFARLVMPDDYLAQADRTRMFAELAVLFGRDLAEQPAIVMKQVAAMSRFDVSGRLGQLAAIPSLVMTASLDRIALPVYGRALAAALPGSRFVEVPGAGHGVTIQYADKVNALLAEHWSTAPAAAAP